MDYANEVGKKIKKIKEKIRGKEVDFAKVRSSLGATDDETGNEKIIAEMLALEKEIKGLREEYDGLSEQLEIIAMVEDVISKVQFYIPLANEVVDKTKGGMNDIIKLLLSVYINISEGTESEAEKVQELQAKAVLRKYKALRNAFKKEKEVSHADIMHMVLAQLGPTGLVNTISQIGKAVPQRKG